MVGKTRRGALILEPSRIPFRNCLRLDQRSKLIEFTLKSLWIVSS